jgi:hypothetical protein
VLNGAAAFVLLLPMSPDLMSIQIALNGAVAFTWTTVLALRLRGAARTTYGVLEHDPSEKVPVA